MRNLPIGFTKIPWGFIQNEGGALTAITSVKERNERAELGEFAIGLFASLGVSDLKLIELQKDPVLANGLQLVTNQPERMISNE